MAQKLFFLLTTIALFTFGVSAMLPELSLYRISQARGFHLSTQRYGPHASALLQNPSCKDFTKHVYISADMQRDMFDIQAVELNESQLTPQIAALCLATLMMPQVTEQRQIPHLNRLFVSLECTREPSCMQKIDTLIYTALINYAVYASDPTFAVKLMQWYSLKSAQELLQVFKSTFDASNRPEIYAAAIQSARSGGMTDAEMERVLGPAMQIAIDYNNKNLFKALMEHYGTGNFIERELKMMVNSVRTQPEFFRWALLNYLHMLSPENELISRLLEVDSSSSVLVLDASLPSHVKSQVRKLAGYCVKYQYGVPSNYAQMLHIQRQLNEEFDSESKNHVLKFLARQKRVGLMAVMIDFFDPHHNGADFRITDLIFDEEIPAESRKLLRELYLGDN